MNRRGFLGALAGVIAAGVVDPELLLWRPGAKTWFLPSAPPLLYDVESLTAADIAAIQTADWIVRESLAMFENNLTAVQLFNRVAQQDLQFTAGQQWPEAALRDRAFARRFSA